MQPCRLGNLLPTRSIPGKLIQYCITAAPTLLKQVTFYGSHLP